MMIEINEPSNELLLRYLRGLLPAADAALFESKCAQDESWQDQLDYIDAVLEDLGLPEDAPFDLCLSLLTYELCAREEKTLIALEACADAQEDTYELELEIDKLLHHLEQLAKNTVPLASELSISQTPKTPMPTPELRVALPAPRFIKLVRLVAVGVKYLGSTIHRHGIALELKYKGKSKQDLPFPLTSAEPAAPRLVAAGSKQNLFLSKG